MPTRLLRHHLGVPVAVGLVAVLLAACGGTTATSVSGVSLEVPSGWTAHEEDPGDDLIAVHQFTPDEPATRLQVVVGCGDESADDLTIGAASQPRDDLVAMEADDAVETQVPGMDAARRTTLTFGSHGQPASLRVAGLYASGDGNLLLVEYVAPLATFDGQTASQILGSVEVERDTLERACGT